MCYISKIKSSTLSCRSNIETMRVVEETDGGSLLKSNV